MATHLSLIQVKVEDRLYIVDRTTLGQAGLALGRSRGGWKQLLRSRLGVDS